MIYMSPRIVARFDRFSIGLGDLVFVSLGSQLRGEHLKVADSSKGWMATYMLQAVPRNIFATLRCSRLE
jgi:hypothetical protein